MSDSGAAAFGVVVLAAGASRRLGQPKHLLRVDGESLLHRAVRMAQATQPVDLVVVFSAETRPLSETIVDLDARTILCTDADYGMGATLRTGIAALASTCEAALIVVIDQPRLDLVHLCALRDRWREDPSRAAASAYANTLGVPAILPRTWFGELDGADSQHGARNLLRTRSAEVSVIEAPQLALDIDTPADLEQFRSSDDQA
jgi:molybdenum cofactor cytidylyltransferase